MPSSLKPLFDRIWQNRQTAPLHTPNLRVEAAAARLGDGAYLLDLGSGPCELLRYTRGFRSVLAVDFSLLPLQSAHAAGAKPVVANFSTDALPFQAGSFSAIALLAALQYADDPRTVLSECYRVLQPSGQLLLGLPNMQLWTRLTKLVILGRFPQVSSDPGYDGGEVRGVRASARGTAARKIREGSRVEVYTSRDVQRALKSLHLRGLESQVLEALKKKN